MNILVICGPTASGKTHLAIQCAIEFNGEIISADSRQVYRKMDLGTGKDLAEYITPHGKIAYHCIDIIDPDKIYTVHQFQRDFTKAFLDIQSRNKLPILVGGTGLYIEAVLKNYKISNVPEDYELRKKLNELDLKELEKKLHDLDIDIYTKTDCSTKKRMIRAIEIALHKDNISILAETLELPSLSPLILNVIWDRKELCSRIDKRLEDRLSAGLIDEVREIMNIVPTERFDMFGMEYKHVSRFIKGEIDYSQMVKDLEKDIHHLAKRQVTWFRGMERRGLHTHTVQDASFVIAKEIICKEKEI